MKNFFKNTKKGRFFAETSRRLYDDQLRTLLVGSKAQSRGSKDWDERFSYFRDNSLFCRFRWVDPTEQWEIPFFSKQESYSYYEKIALELKAHIKMEGSDNCIDRFLRYSYLHEDNPCLALLAWKEICDQIVDDGKAIIDEEGIPAFWHSTILLLCFFIENMSPDDPALASVASVLNDAFDEYYYAFRALTMTYPPILNDEANRFIKREKEPELYLGEEYRMPDFPCDEDDENSLAVKLRSIFKKHLDHAGCRISEDLADDIWYNLTGGLHDSDRTRYLLPFVCTKLYAAIALRLQGGFNLRKLEYVDDALEDVITSELKNYKTLTDLERTHRKAKLYDESIYHLKESHPLILFMQDMISLIYDEEIINLKMPEHVVQQQINANWLALYLFGMKEYFDDPLACSYYSDMTLPILLPILFGDEEDNVTLCYDWLFGNTSIENVEFRRDTEIQTLWTMSMERLDAIAKNVGDLSAWRKQLSFFIYDDALWQADGLTVDSAEYQKEIELLNQLHHDVAAFLSKIHKAKSNATHIVRMSCIEWIVHDARISLCDVLEELCSLY